MAAPPAGLYPDQPLPAGVLQICIYFNLITKTMEEKENQFIDNHKRFAVKRMYEVVEGDHRRKMEATSVFNSWAEAITTARNIENLVSRDVLVCIYEV